MIIRLPHTKDIDAEINRLFCWRKTSFQHFPIDAYFKRFSDYSVRGKMVRSKLGYY